MPNRIAILVSAAFDICTKHFILFGMLLLYINVDVGHVTD